MSVCEKCWAEAVHRAALSQQDIATVYANLVAQNWCGERRVREQEARK